MDTLNITFNSTEWLQIVSSYDADNNITPQLGNLNLASGFVLKRENVPVIDGVQYPINSYYLQNAQAATDLIERITNNGNKVYPHALVTNLVKDPGELDPEFLKSINEVMLSQETSADQKDQARMDYEAMLESLDPKTSVIFTAVVL